MFLSRRTAVCNNGARVEGAPDRARGLAHGRRRQGAEGGGGATRDRGAALRPQRLARRRGYTLARLPISRAESSHWGSSGGRPRVRGPCVGGSDLVVVEVLSPTTEAIDRGKKAAYYRSCPTIQEYMMVDSEEVFVEVHRLEEGRWTINNFEPGDSITLESLGIQFPIEDAYEGTSLTYEP